MPRKDETPLNSDFADLLHEFYDGSVEKSSESAVRPEANERGAAEFVRGAS